MAGLFPNPKRDVAFPVVGSALLFAIIVGIGLLYQSFFGGAGERLVTIVLIDAILVLGLQIYIGNTGVLSFGHIGFGAVAGYTFAVLAISPEEKLKRIPDAPFGLADVHLSPVVAALVAIVVTVAFAAVVGAGLARSGAASGSVAATVITLALLFVTHEVARNWPDLTGGDRAGLTFKIGQTLDGRLAIYLCLFGSILLARLYGQSRGGRLAVAAREDDLAARAMGINPLVQQMVALLLSVAVVAIGASLRVYERGSILPDNFFFDLTLVTLVMLIVGGRNSVTGALIGVVVIAGGQELARQMGKEGFSLFGIDFDSAPLDWVFRENLQSVVLGVAMLAFMIWRRTGIVDDWELDEWLYKRFGRGNEQAPASLPSVDPDPSVTLDVRAVDVVFGGFQALDSAGLEAKGGEVVGIIGPNGAGKTTLVNVITRQVNATSGSVTLNGQNLTAVQSFEVARAGLVRTFQNLRLFGALTVAENVECSLLVAQQHRRGRDLPTVDELVVSSGLWEHRHRRARELDYGNSRRLELARAAAMAPSFLILDEPTSGMSDIESVAMIDQVKQMAALVGAGVLVIDHDLNFINGISERIYCLDRGRVICHGTPAEVQANPQVQAAYLGSNAES